MDHAEELKKHFICDPCEYREGNVSVFEQEFTLDKDQKIGLTITALGIYEAEIDGRKVGDELFAPGFTYYPRELQYNAYTISSTKGKHTLRVYLAQGWYAGRFTFDNKVQIYGKTPAVSWLIDCGEKIYVSNTDSVDLLSSPYEYAGEYDGEIYHASRLKKRDEKPVASTERIPEVFIERCNAVRLREEVTVKHVYTHDAYTILDFGENFAGIISIDPSKMDHDSLTLRHGELLTEDGSLYTNNLRKAKQQIIYYKDENNSDIYTPRFTYMGFRYVELKGCAYKEGLLQAHRIYSDMKRTGTFTCQNVSVQQLYENQISSQRSNYVEVPTDCPQRDERMGYTGDGHVFARSGAYNYDTRDFMKKFLDDIRYSQMDIKDGYIPSTVPCAPGTKCGFLNMLGWGNAVTLIPEMLYEQFGDESYLVNQYDSIKAFADLECRKCRLTGLWNGVNLGDWLMVGKDMKYMAQHNGPVSNSFVIHDFKVASTLAKRTGHTEDASRWEKAFLRAKKAYISRYIQKNGEMKDDYQGAYVMALKLVVDKDDPLYAKVYQKLKAHLMKEGMQTGFFATEHLLPLLCENNDAKLAYDILLNEKCPGWMYEIKHGATSIWERWDAIKEDGSVNESKMSDDNMVSFNHYAFGSVAEFYYRCILGIEPALPGFAKLRFQPVTDPRLQSVSGSYASVHGLIRSDWKYAEDHVRIHLITPVETEVILEDGTRQEVEKGEYEFIIQKG